MYLVTASQMQHMDKQTIESFGIPGIVLMENAGRGAVNFLIKKYPDLKNKKTAVIAGRGNNGGDGFVMARYLLEKNVDVTVFLLSRISNVTGDAKANLELFQKLCKQYGRNRIMEIPDVDAFEEHKPWILSHPLFIDAILGTGLNSDVQGFFKDAIDLLNSCACPVFSVDIPSGLNSDTGQPMGTAIKAAATATFAFAKVGHVLYPGNIHTGELEIIDIGIPRLISDTENLSLSVLEKKDIAAKFSPREFNTHKGSFGHLLVIAGSEGKTGAAALCSNAAMRCGTGKVTLGIAKSLNPILETMVIEPMTYPLPEKNRVSEKDKGYLSDSCLDEILALLKDKQAMAIGPGLGTHKSTQSLVKQLIEKSPVPMVIDADAINCIVDDPGILNKKQAPAILTPHPGEMARLCNKTTGQIQANRITIASGFAAEHDVTLVLKGAQTIIALPDGRSFICPTGNPGLASGGTGDVLTGIISGFCAQGFSMEDAGCAGVYIHGMSADILSDKMGRVGFIASDLIQQIPESIHICLQ
ncbi:MAG: NAD(P)H-hydrate dehydratase [Proteobacteria bacterium]|nr:NAD(P)H-hydrate dehydratase [Pseudomonadota bacterium]MBU1387421.1 NAD(P)H-hydrate dehydratase [Pseudomonadota bacterium]MBU1541706.1 NAD(P)H-hydrate dehydratase [Pseudomonadota bacterium]MBU2429722.1 NAD(P)H-hydrate dehydratase [Pseudomonadota bacterium]MBU2481991.1 NAD(P)H-hydrate dehydratase [Pseudomonadota bacterium]